MDSLKDSNDGTTITSIFGEKSVSLQKVVNSYKKKKGKSKSKSKKFVTILSLHSNEKEEITSTQSVDSYRQKMPFLPHEAEYLESCPIQFYQHQLDAIRWMYSIEKSKTENPKAGNHVGGILGDEMGLGKTVDGLGLIYYDLFLYKYIHQPIVPTLIIAPLMLLHHWGSEALNRLKLDKKQVLIYHTVKRFRLFKEAIQNNQMPLMVIVTYETVQNDFNRFSKNETSYIYNTKWKRVLLDEAHVARNAKRKTFNALKSIKTDAMWAITGTPIFNDTEDIRKLSVLCTPDDCLKQKSSAKEQQWKEKFLLRRTKKMLNIPPLYKQDEWVNFSDKERESYKFIEMWADSSFGELNEQIILVLLRLRQFCNHSWLQKTHAFTSPLLQYTKRKYGVDDVFKQLFIPCGVEDEIVKRKLPKKKRSRSSSTDDHKYSDDELENYLEQFEYSSKMNRLLELLNYYKNMDPNAKSVIFSQFTTNLDLIEIMLIQQGIPALRVDGRQPTKIRETIMEKFRTDQRYPVLLVSLRAGGVGLNLVPARILYLMDPWWNLSVEHQAQDRIHRIGQTQTVFVHRILVSNTIEEDVLSIQKSKSNQESSFYSNSEPRKILSLKDLNSIYNSIHNRNKKR